MSRAEELRQQMTPKKGKKVQAKDVAESMGLTEDQFKRWVDGGSPMGMCMNKKCGRISPMLEEGNNCRHCGGELEMVMPPAVAEYSE